MKKKLFDVMLFVGIFMIVELTGLCFFNCYLQARAPYTLDIRAYGLFVATPAALICDIIGDIADFSHRTQLMMGSIFCILAIYAYLITLGCRRLLERVPGKRRYIEDILILSGVCLSGFACSCFAQATTFNIINSLLLFPYNCVYGFAAIVKSILSDGYISLYEQRSIPLWHIGLYWGVCGAAGFLARILRRVKPAPTARQGTETVPTAPTAKGKWAWDFVFLKIVWRYIAGFLIGGTCYVLILCPLLESSNKTLIILGSILGLPALLSACGAAGIIWSFFTLDCVWVIYPLLFFWGGIYGIYGFRQLEKIIRKYFPRKWLSFFETGDSPVFSYAVFAVCVILVLLGGIAVLVGGKECFLYILSERPLEMGDFFQYGVLWVVIGWFSLRIGILLGRKYHILQKPRPQRAQ